MLAKMKKLLVLILLWTSITVDANKYNLTVGPKKTETGRFIYTNMYGKNHCHICPMKALMDSTFSFLQQPLCYDNYKNITAEITPYEKENKLYALCANGDPPGCGGLPNHTLTDSTSWYCDAGYSLRNYSVYFSCAMICNPKDIVVRSYYCNEQLQWELDFTVSSPQSCQVPGKAPLQNFTDRLQLIIAAVGGSCAILICGIIFVVYIIYKRRKKLSLRRSASDEANEPLNADRPSPDAIERGNNVVALCKKKNNIPLLPLSNQDDSLSSSNTSSNSTADTSLKSVNTDHPARPEAVPNIKIMTSKNNSSQMSVPIQSGYYSIEIGSDYFIIPDCPGGIAVTDFQVGCKTNGKSFRGQKVQSFMYSVCNVREEDDDMYTWTMKLENGTQHYGNFQIYVAIPDQLSSYDYRRGPYGEENLNSNVNMASNINNQEVQAEIHGVLSYIPLSNNLYSVNHPGPPGHRDHQRDDSGLSMGPLHSSGDHSVSNVRGEDVRYSTSGYETQPSNERHMDPVNQLLAQHEPLDPSTISRLDSSRLSNDSFRDSIDNHSNYERPLIAGHQEGPVLSSNHDRSLLASLEEQPLLPSHEGRPLLPPDGIADSGHHEEYHLTDDEDDDNWHQTGRKHYWENDNDDERCTSIALNNIPHGEINDTESVRPVIDSMPEIHIPSTNPVEEFDQKVTEALQHKPVPAHVETNNLNLTETSESDLLENSKPKPTENGVFNIVETTDSNPKENVDSKSTEKVELNQAEKVDSNSSEKVDRDSSGKVDSNSSGKVDSNSSGKVDSNSSENKDSDSSRVDTEKVESNPVEQVDSNSAEGVDSNSLEGLHSNPAIRSELNIPTELCNFSFDFSKSI